MHISRNHGSVMQSICAAALWKSKLVEFWDHFLFVCFHSVFELCFVLRNYRIIDTAERR